MWLNMNRNEYVRNAARQASLDFYKLERDAWIKKAREYAEEYALEDGEVTADIIHDVCPMPDGIDRRSMAAVFMGMKWLRFARSRRKVNHHRTISVFTIAG